VPKLCAHIQTDRHRPSRATVQERERETERETDVLVGVDKFNELQNLDIGPRGCHRAADATAVPPRKSGYANRAVSVITTCAIHWRWVAETPADRQTGRRIAVGVGVGGAKTNASRSNYIRSSVANSFSRRAARAAQRLGSQQDHPWFVSRPGKRSYKR